MVIITFNSLKDFFAGIPAGDLFHVTAPSGIVYVVYLLAGDKLYQATVPEDKGIKGDDPRLVGSKQVAEITVG